MMLKVGTAGSAGIYYFVGSAAATVINRHLPEVKITPESTAGGVENMRRVARRNLDFAICAPGDYLVVRKDNSAGADKVSFVAGVHNTVQNLVVRADKAKGMRSAKDFFRKGARMGVGEPGSSIQNSTRVLLQIFGLTFDDIDAHKISQAESAEAIKDGIIDALYVGGGIPLTSVTSVTQAINAVILPFTEEDIKNFQKIAAYQFGATIPANSYRGQTKDVYTVAYASMLIARSDLDPNIVYKVAQVIHDHSAEIASIHPAGKEWSMGSVYRNADWVRSFGYKFHPGMVKYLKDRKQWNPKYEK